MGEREPGSVEGSGSWSESRQNGCLITSKAPACENILDVPWLWVPLSRYSSVRNRKSGVGKQAWRCRTATCFSPLDLTAVVFAAMVFSALWVSCT